MRYWSYGSGYGAMNPGFSIIGLILNVLFWGLIIMLIIKIFRHHSHPHCCDREMIEGEVSGDNSLNIIKERYAKGEIDKKEFEQLKKDLS